MRIEKNYLKSIVYWFVLKFYVFASRSTARTVDIQRQQLQGHFRILNNHLQSRILLLTKKIIKKFDSVPSSTRPQHSLEQSISCRVELTRTRS